jgi:hypothetical protein
MRAASGGCLFVHDAAGLLAVKFPYLLIHGGNIHAGKECAPSFHIVFLGRHKQVPQLQGLFRPKMLKQYHKRILDKRLFGELGVCIVFSDCFHSGAETEAE